LAQHVFIGLAANVLEVFPGCTYTSSGKAPTWKNPLKLMSI
jgi:hypothetical protein